MTAMVRECLTKECNKVARIRGYCTACAHHIYNATSDGILTGCKPKLNSEQCGEIKRLYARFKTNREIAKALSISQTLVRRVLSGEYTPNDA